MRLFAQPLQHENYIMSVDSITWNVQYLGLPTVGRNMASHAPCNHRSLIRLWQRYCTTEDETLPPPHGVVRRCMFGTSVEATSWFMASIIVLCISCHWQVLILHSHWCVHFPAPFKQNCSYPHDMKAIPGSWQQLSRGGQPIMSPWS